MQARNVTHFERFYTTTVPDYDEIKATDNRNNAPAFKKIGAV